MLWDHIENSIAILQMYKSAPKLGSVRVKELILSDNGPTIKLKFDLESLPDSPPKKWQREKYNTVHLELYFSGAENFSLNGWCSNNIADISVEEGSDYMKKVRIGNGNVQADFLCRAISINKISPYLNG